MNTIDINININEVQTWARESGAIARQCFNRVLGRRKADRSWVTEADETIEHMLVERITARYPQHGIIGEEQTRHATDREFLWAIDPLDGTGSFVDGLPTWGVSIGLLRHGQPYLGVVYLPLLDDCYWAGPTGGAFLNDRPIQVIAPRPWESQDWIAVPSDIHKRFAIEFIGKTRALACIVASICYTARGSAIGALVTRAAIWDLAAALAILRAAGGIAAGLSGMPIEIVPLLNGGALREPIVIGEPTHVQALCAAIHEH